MNPFRQIALLLVALLSVAAVVWLYLAAPLYLRRRRNFAVSGAADTGLLGEGAGSQALVAAGARSAKRVGNTPIPMTQKSFYSAADTAAIRAKMDAAFRKYGELFTEAAANSDVPLFLFRGVQFIENGEADTVAVSNAGAVGLMQIAPANATDSIIRMRKKRLLSEAEKAVLQQELGGVKYGKLMNAALGTAVITATDLKRPRLNCQVGAIVLSELLNEHGVNDFWRFDEVVVRYNAGYYFRLPNTANADALIAATRQTETKNYILKLAGQNGTLELLT